MEHELQTDRKSSILCAENASYWRETAIPLLENMLPQIIKDYYDINVASVCFNNEGHSNIICIITSEKGENITFRIEPPFINSRKYDDFKRITINPKSFAVPMFCYHEKILPAPLNDFSIAGYNFIEGNTKYRWYEVPKDDDLKKIVKAYDELNENLRFIDTTNASVAYTERFNEELDAVIKHCNNICDKSIEATFNSRFNDFLANAKLLLANISRITKDLTPHYVHNDFQPGNILFNENDISGIIDFENLTLGYTEIDTILSGFRIAKSNGSNTELNIDRICLKKFISHFPSAWKIFENYGYKFFLSFFALRESVRYMLSAINNLDVMRTNIGFLPCFLTVANYYHEPLRSLIIFNGRNLPDENELRKIENNCDEIIFVQLYEPIDTTNSSIAAAKQYIECTTSKRFYLFPLFADNMPAYRLLLRLEILCPRFNNVYVSKEICKYHLSLPSKFVFHSFQPQQTNESKDDRSRALFITRAQPFHNGHLEIIEKALEKYDEVIVVLASAEASFTEDNPLTAAQRMEITNAVLWARHNGHFWIFPVAYNNYIAENMPELKLLCPDFNVVFSTNPVHAKMARLANIPSEMPKIKSDVRATTIRENVKKALPADSMMPREALQIFMKYKDQLI